MDRKTGAGEERGEVANDRPHRRRFIHSYLLRLLVCAALLPVFLGCNKPEAADGDTKLGYQLPAGETHFTFTLPAVPANPGFDGRPETTFRIPREYVWFEGVLSRRDSDKWRPYQAAVRVELPELKPFRKRPLPRRGTPEWDQWASKSLPEWYLVDIGSGSGLGGRNRLLHSLRTDVQGQVPRKDIVPDGQVYGLMRYSPVRCYTPEHLEQPHLKQFLKAKPADDPMPQPNCRVDRHSALYFSPTTVHDPDQVVFVKCLDGGCRVSSEVGSVGFNLDIKGDQLHRWSEIVGPIRQLLRSFIVRDVNPGATPGSSSSR